MVSTVQSRKVTQKNMKITRVALLSLLSVMTLLPIKLVAPANATNLTLGGMSKLPLARKIMPVFFVKEQKQNLV